MRHMLLCTCISLCWSTSVFAGPTTVATLEKHLQAGELATAEAVLQAELKAAPQDAQARFGLGTVQFLRAVEGLMQGLYRHGMLERERGLLSLWIELPLPVNPRPEKVSYAKLRQIIQNFISGLSTAEATLAGITTEDVKLPLHFGQIRLDFTGDGKADEEETLWRIYARINRGVRVQPEVAAQFVIAFDTADVYWLRGYCHLLMGLGEATLAHDWKELFERTGHIAFPSVESPYPYLNDYNRQDNSTFSMNRITDFIAFIHLINFPVVAPERMHSSLDHLEAMLDVSSQSWDFVERETDDDQEWIPNPKQHGVIPNVRVTADMISSWREFLNEGKQLLRGKKLIPFWRGHEGQGVNLRLAFTQSRPFDLVMWIQGSGAAPYLENGPVTDPAVWNRLQRVFGGQFFGFAVWFN